MKKSVVLALAAALACGAASTAFAANPFADVPADHWAYDAVAQLVEDGVIDGYGDGSYNGQQEITRYEMAQMIARAMAKGGADQEAVDKLAAEFSEELNALGVRVAALEKKADNVKFYGQARYTWKRVNNGDDVSKQSYLQLRLYADAAVNKHWTAKTAFYYNTKGDARNSSATVDANLDFAQLWYLYARGQYGNTTIDLGQIENFEPVTEGMLWDENYTGVQVITGKDLKIGLQGGRMDSGYYEGGSNGDLLGVFAQYNKDKLGLGAAYYNVRGLDISPSEDKANIWAVSAQYKFAKDWRLYGVYAANTAAEDRAADKNSQDKAYNIQLNYKGIDKNKPGSWGLVLAYKYLGDQVVSDKYTYDYSERGTKGFEVGANVMLDRNIHLELGYMNGEDLSNNDDVELTYSRFRLYF